MVTQQLLQLSSFEEACNAWMETHRKLCLMLSDAPSGTVKKKKPPHHVDDAGVVDDADADADDSR